MSAPPPVAARARRAPRTVVLVGVLVAVVLGAGTLAGVQVWAWLEFRAGKAALERREFDTADRHLARALRVWPGSPETHLLAARAARYLERYDDAEHHLDECKRLDKDWGAGKIERNMLDAQRGRLNRPLERYLLDLLAFGQAEDRPLVFEALVQGYMKTFRMEEAMAMIDLWHKRYPDSGEPLCLRGKIYEQFEQHDKAEKAYNEALKVEPTHVKARLYLADVLMMFHRPQDAIEHYNYLYRLRPDDPDVMMGMAKCQAELGQMAEATAILDRLVRMRPDDSVALRERGRLAVKVGDPAAEQWLRQALERDPFDRHAHYELNLCLRMQGRTKEAEESLAASEKIKKDIERLYELRKEIARSPHDPAPRYESGMIFKGMRMHEEAIRWFESALFEDPGHKPTHEALADCYEQVGKPDLAAQHRQRALQARAEAGRK